MCSRYSILDKKNLLTSLNIQNVGKNLANKILTRYLIKFADGTELPIRAVAPQLLQSKF